MSVNILSVNCQGLGDIAKRKDVLNYLRNLNYNIYCLQDTHFSTELEREVRNQWGYQCYFSSFTTNSRGVAILINNNFDFRVIEEKILLSISFNDFQKGRGYWKFNNSLLGDKDYLDCINEVIRTVRKQYAVPIYNMAKYSIQISLRLYCQ
jgi:exonuclease III